MNEQLVKRIRQCPNLPTLPTIAIEVLGLAQKSDVDIGEIASTISRDPALSGKILRTVNSSFYARSHAVSTVSHALVILGLQSVKTLVLGFSLVRNLATAAPGGFNHLNYWKRSIYAATAARTLAAKVDVVQQEEVFLTALLKDIGMLVLDQVLGEAYGAVHAGLATHEQLVEREVAAFGMNHAEAGGILANQWKLPPVLATPIAGHHAPQTIEDPALRKLTELVQLSGRCADVFVDEQAADAIAAVRRLCNERHGLSEADADALLEQIGRSTAEAASLFEINIGQASDYEAILKHANEALVEMTLSSQMHASSLAEQNEQLKQKAETDALTGLANRARFDHFVADQFRIAQTNGTALSMLLLDLDKFKSINDRYGHPVGDLVLKTVGQMLSKSARGRDLAARYGGEEMVLVVPGANRAVAAAIAENIRRAIAAKPIKTDQGTVPVTASIGVATYEPGLPFKEHTHLVKAADLAVYAAKRAGRNCVRVFALSKPANGAA